jgi:oligopeptide/dipeptide ABC transporter ATP-binding protein
VTAPLLAVRDLTVSFPTADGPRRILAGISYDIPPGRTLGVVGESGCGKSMTALALMGLVPHPGATDGSIRFEGNELLGQPAEAWRKLRGNRVAMIFQEPMTALNPVMTVGKQVAEALVLHQGLDWKAAGERGIAMLDAVGIASPRARAAAYPHQLSGGMRQRAMIAMALACRPTLLIADEPTTALDVTIQAQILDLMQDLQDDIGMAIQFVSHNLAVVAEVSHEIIVMYAGRIVERAPAAVMFAAPLHPYTAGLIATLPDATHRADRLPVIKGGVPNLASSFAGCRFAARCPRVVPSCRDAEPPLQDHGDGHLAACFRVGA